jgi:catechol 2,3-dioxygenase-like lactoylglutathione lyase family enzyme
MNRSVALVTLLVHDCDAAIDFFVRALRFRLIEDTASGQGKRRVVVAPPGEDGAALLLSRASTPAQAELVGRQAADRVFLFLESTDFWLDHRHMLAHGVAFAEAPREEPWGTVAVFTDLCGNRWDLLQRS